jgi:transposase InsO family protein
MQVEHLNREKWRSRIELVNAIFEYLEGFHNRQRCLSALGMLRSFKFENLHSNHQLVHEFRLVNRKK